MKVVVCGDLHADARTAGLPRFGDVDQALATAVNHAIDAKADYFIFGGDLCDPDAPNLIRCMRLAQLAAAKLASYKIFSFWLAGNHDVLEDGYGTTTLDCLLGNYTVPVTTPQISLSGEIGLLPYTATRNAYDPVAVVNGWHAGKRRPKLIVSHLMLEGISAGSETEDFPRGRDVFAPIDLIRQTWPDVVHVNAHYHERQTYRGVEIPGSLVRLTKAEANHDPCFLTFTI